MNFLRKPHCLFATSAASLVVLVVGCDSKNPVHVTDSAPTPEVSTSEEQFARVCFVDMARIFAAVSIREVEQARVDQLAQASSRKVAEGRQRLEQLGNRIKELQEELRQLSEGDPTDLDQDELQSKRDELVTLADAFRVQRQNLGGLAVNLQRNVDVATVQASGKVWQECAKMVSGVAGRMEYDYVINLGARDSNGFPVMVGRTSAKDDITEQVLELLAAGRIQLRPVNPPAAVERPKEGDDSPAGSVAMVEDLVERQEVVQQNSESTPEAGDAGRLDEEAVIDEKKSANGPD